MNKLYEALQGRCHNNHDVSRLTSFSSYNLHRIAIQPDIDFTQLPETVGQDSSETPIDVRVVPPFIPQPELEVPLATSLKVSDVVHPSEVEPQIDLPSHPIRTASKNEEHSSVIEEVAQLEQLEQENDVLDRFRQQAQAPDSTMRVAVAAELGELAAQGQHREQIIVLLNQLSQDVDPQVRVQAIASMGRIPPDISNAIV